MTPEAQLLLKGKTILVCEDQGIVQLQILRLLQNAGADVHATAYTGDFCVQSAIQKRPDIILMDVGLPGVDGWTACEQILKVYSPCLVVLTGNDPAEVDVMMKRVPVSGYIPKPVEGEELLRQLVRCISDFYGGSQEAEERIDTH